MKIKTLTATYDRRFNLGDYNSLRIEVSVSAELDEEDWADAVMLAIQLRAREAVRSEYIRLKDSVRSHESIEAKSQIAS